MVLYLKGLRTMTPFRRNKLRILHIKCYMRRYEAKKKRNMYNFFYTLKDFVQSHSRLDAYGNVEIFR